jgi:predicted RNA-binding protein with PIN domain
LNHLLLIDVCNILLSESRLRALLDTHGMEVAIADLMGRLRVLHDTEGYELHGVVDGQGRALEQVLLGNEKTISLFYTPTHQTADSVIEAWLMRLDKSWTVLVASGDRAIQHTAVAHHAEILNASQLLEWADRVARRSLRKHPQQKTFGNSLESYFKDR